MSKKQRGAALSAKLRADLTKLVKSEGERSVARLVGINVTALIRAYAGLPVLAGTAALIERALEKQQSATA